MTAEMDFLVPRRLMSQLLGVCQLPLALFRLKTSILIIPTLCQLDLKLFERLFRSLEVDHGDRVI